MADAFSGDYRSHDLPSFLLQKRNSNGHPRTCPAVRHKVGKVGHSPMDRLRPNIQHRISLQPGLEDREWEFGREARSLRPRGAVRDSRVVRLGQWQSSVRPSNTPLTWRQELDSEPNYIIFLQLALTNYICAALQKTTVISRDSPFPSNSV